jgi:hypothetical protein
MARCITVDTAGVDGPVDGSPTLMALVEWRQFRL